MSKKILVLPGDGIGPEIVHEAVKVLARLRDDFGLDVDLDEALVGGAAIDATGGPLPEATLDLAREADAVLLGAVGGPKWEPLDIAIRPEKGLLGLRHGSLSSFEYLTALGLGCLQRTASPFQVVVHRLVLRAQDRPHPSSIACHPSTLPAPPSTTVPSSSGTPFWPRSG